MKIAFVYDAVYPWEKGGAQKRIWELARRLADNHDVHLYGMHYWDGPAVMERGGVTFHGVCAPKELYVDGRRSIPQALSFAASVTPALLKENFDVIDCQEFPYFPCFGAKLHELIRDSTLIITWYEVWNNYWYDYLGTKGILGKAVEHATVRLADTVIPISEFIQSDLGNLGRTSGHSVVPNGVDYHGLQKITVADADWDVIYVGRLAEHKNVDLLLKATTHVNDELDESISVGIIGDGPERASLEKYAEKLGVTDDVEFLGFVEADEDVIGHLKAATVFVLPSIREGFPNTILEANACGVPSIVVDHEENGSTAVVEHGDTGFVTDVSTEAIADRLVKLLTTPELQEELSAGARQFGQDHDWSVIVDMTEQVYMDAISNGR